MNAARKPGGEVPQNIASAIADVSERASVLVREEIELAKAEVTDKVTKLAKGAIVGVVAGVFFLFALIFILVGLAWLLYFYLPVPDFAYFWGFFATAVILIVLGVIAGLIAAKVVKRGSPPMPTMAIAEAQKIRATVSAPAPTLPAPVPASATEPLTAPAAATAQPVAAPAPVVTPEPEAAPAPVPVPVPEASPLPAPEAAPPVVPVPEPPPVPPPAPGDAPAPGGQV